MVHGWWKKSIIWQLTFFKMQLPLARPKLIISQIFIEKVTMSVPMCLLSLCLVLDVTGFRDAGGVTWISNRSAILEMCTVLLLCTAGVRVMAYCREPPASHGKWVHITSPNFAIP